MRQVPFNDEDLRQIREYGMTAEQVSGQLERFMHPPPAPVLLRPCTPGDGIRWIGRQEREEFARTYQREASGHRCLKFVPASGAASRMFKSLLTYMTGERPVKRAAVRGDAEAGQKEAVELLRFMDRIEDFPFYTRLSSVMSQQGLEPASLIERGEFTDILRFLLTEEGLNYAELPKGLLAFHRYPAGARTAMEEHLAEAPYYAAGGGVCPIHFTVSPEHLAAFEDLSIEVKSAYETAAQVKFDLGFSVQDPSTDTLAVDPENRPFRDEKGRLVFRPGGHGALLRNLNTIEADLVFIKNIDNVVMDRLKGEILEWKKVLGGYLLTIQKRIFGYLESLASSPSPPDPVEEIAGFLKEDLGESLPERLGDTDRKRRDYLMDRLNRPIRVCGMVRNVGEPGGGPFWVKDSTGPASPQIVEKAQVDSGSEEQQGVFSAATHFNPVDIVCGIKDFRGRTFDLARYMDPEAVIITRKTKNGRELKALEHPGLWNGSMARWITLFVEVPSKTFNPVKTVNDLLREAHQPG